MKHIIKILIALCAVMLLSASAYADGDVQSQEAILARNLIESICEDYVLPADVREVFAWTVAHRLILAAGAESAGRTPEDILIEIVERTPAPRIK